MTKAGWQQVVEGEANAFAMELLMPTKFVKDEMAKRPQFDLTNDKHVKELAEVFQVPIGIMVKRLVEFKVRAK
jgi:Zn-dependent peptidase ImmA (M78 family)